MSADGTAAPRWAAVAADDPRALLPIEEVAILLDVSVKTLKSNHLANPAQYPAERVGVLWRIPRAWVEAKTRWVPPDGDAA